jgi:hypothetical protein
MDTPSYFHQRMDLLGIADTQNEVMLRKHNPKTDQTELMPDKIFTESPKGIDILVYTLDRQYINYTKEGKRWKDRYKITRLENPIVKSDGDTLKYLMPKGVQTFPFFPPALVDKYDAKENIATLFITEGYFKAFKAQMHGIDCVGLPSITCMKDKETAQLHADIKKLIETCNVQRVVWLVDGDCRNITSKEIEDGVDLSRRPNVFFKTVNTFYELLSGYEDIQKYFAHINSDNLEGKPKGLDDLLCAFPNEVTAIKEELETFDIVAKGMHIGKYSVKTNITYGVSRVRMYFFLHDVDQFYLHHLEQRPELRNKDFKFYGTLYRYDDGEGKLTIKIPSDANRYFRVGDEYYEYIEIPNKYNELNKTFNKRKKETIKDDNVKDIFKHIPKYKAFCNVPEHVNYQRVISNCFNIYSPFQHEAEEGTCELTLDFIKHIFGTEKVEVKPGVQIERYELGLDYLTLLYKKPQQILPILCLASSERQTGKTTFAKWLNLIFTENMAIVGNEDLSNKFNSHWASKLIICCDETKIDKHTVMEKVKSLSTADTITKENKGLDQKAMDFFGKFIFLTNNEDNFISIDEQEIRFWIIKVPTITNRNVMLLDDLIEEIPAFLYYLNTRQMVTENRERHWFETKLLKTEALTKVVQNSKPAIERILRTRVAQLFTDIEGIDAIHMPFWAVKSELLQKTSYDDAYIKRTLREMGYFAQKIQRKSFPRQIETRDENGGTRVGFTQVSFHCTYYEFKREEFADLIENMMDNSINENNAELINDDLPF